MLNAVTAALITVYAYVCAVAAAGLIYVRRRFGKPSIESCRGCPLQGFCSRLGLSRVAPPVTYVSSVSDGFKKRFYAALGAGCAVLIVLAVIAGSPYLIIGLMLPLVIAASISKL